MDTQGHVSPEEVRAGLRALYAGDPEANLQKALLQACADDTKATGEKGRWRPSPLVVLFALLALCLLGIFLYFTL